MRRASFADATCSIARSLEVVGEWWTLLILRDAFLGVTRFKDFQQRLGIAPNILTARLDTLVGAEILERRTYEAARDRSDYVLTKKGRALWPVLVTLRQWGDEWMVGRDQAPVQLQHTSCGHVGDAVLHCEHCGERLAGRDIRSVRGPGLTDESLLPLAGDAG
jgi:DNA-binding HxlR family transcriptional regulator